jgi:ABC-type multidrug transport system fused ATPase/permease subunit
MALPRVRTDPLLVGLVAVQRLIPIGVLWLFVHRSAATVFVVSAFAAWGVAAALASRTRFVAAETRERALEDAARAIGRRAAPTVRGGAHDELMSLVWRGVDARAEIASQIHPTLVASVIALPCAFAVAAAIDGVRIAMVAIVAGLCALVARVPLARRYQAVLVDLIAAYRRIASDLGHGLRALEDLQAHGLVDAYQRRLEEGARELARVDRRVGREATLATWAPLVMAGLVVAAILGRPLVAQPQAGLLRLATIAVFAPIAIGLARSVVQERRQRLVAEALDALVALPPDLPPPTSPRPLPDELAPIEWAHVTFRYPPPLDVAALKGTPSPRPPTQDRAPVLDDATIRWTGAHPLAIVGPNGSGKSTLLALLLRLVDPDEGSVRIGDVDVRDVSADALHARIAYLPQRPLVLEGMSVREAMLLVAPERLDSALRDALARVGLIERLSGRSEDPLAVKCATLSVGEAQRVALARALARDPELLVLDEPEAALDPTARGELRELLGVLAREGRTIVVATQHEEVAPPDSVVLRLPLPKGASMELDQR